VVATAYEHGWVRAVEHIADADGRLRRLTVGSQLAVAGAFVVGAVAGLPGRAGWQQLLLAVSLACSAYATDAVARRRRRPENHCMAQLAVVIAITLAGAVGPAGSAAAGALTLVLLVLTSAPYLERIHAVVLVGACSAATLAVLVATDRSALPASWFGLVAVLVLAVTLVSALRRDGRLLRELVELETRDPVTGLPNGRYLEQALTHEFSRASARSPLAVLALEIDGFRDLDHAHGFRVGDEVLAAIAGRLQSELRDVDTLARADRDSDVLVVLLPGRDETMAWEVAAMLRVRAEQRSEEIPAVTISVGIAVHAPVDGSAPSAPSAPRLLAQARQALTDAAGAGGDRAEVAGRGMAAAWPAPAARD
jgi:diguanylate cyclase (GGDEF)-like protein